MNRRQAFSEKLRKWWAAASALILLTIAIIGFLYDALHRFAPTLVSQLASPEEVLIFLMALLCGGLGAERLLTLKKMETDIEIAQEQRATLIESVARVSHDIEKLLARVTRLRTEIVADLKTVERNEEDIITAVKRINKTEALIGSREIETAARKLVDDCGDSDKIKATGQYRAGDGLTHGYFQHVAERVARALENEGDMEYHVVVPAPPPGEQRVDDERVKVFRNADLQDRLTMRGAHHPWPFEVLIGGHSMIIALLGGEKKSKYEVAVKITDPDFVEKAAEWYREVAWEGSDKF